MSYFAAIKLGLQIAEIYQKEVDKQNREAYQREVLNKLEHITGSLDEMKEILERMSIENQYHRFLEKMDFPFEKIKTYYLALSVSKHEFPDPIEIAGEVDTALMNIQRGALGDFQDHNSLYQEYYDFLDVHKLGISKQQALLDFHQTVILGSFVRGIAILSKVAPNIGQTWMNLFKYGDHLNTSRLLKQGLYLTQAIELGKTLTSRENDDQLYWFGGFESPTRNIIESLKILSSGTTQLNSETMQPDWIYDPIDKVPKNKIVVGVNFEESHGSIALRIHYGTVNLDKQILNSESVLRSEGDSIICNSVYESSSKEYQLTSIDTRELTCDPNFVVVDVAIEKVICDSNCFGKPSKNIHLRPILKCAPYNLGIVDFEKAAWKSQPNDFKIHDGNSSTFAHSALDDLHAFEKYTAFGACLPINSIETRKNGDLKNLKWNVTSNSKDWSRWKFPLTGVRFDALRSESFHIDGFKLALKSDFALDK